MNKEKKMRHFLPIGSISRKVMFQCGFEKPTDEEEVKTCINMDHKSKNSVWFTITDLDGNIIGETGLLRMFPAWHQTDLTIIIPDPKMQHKGYGQKQFVSCLIWPSISMKCIVSQSESWD